MAKTTETEELESVFKLGKLFSPPKYKAPPVRDLAPERKGDYEKPAVHSLDKPSYSADSPTFRSDKPLFMKKGGSVRGNGCCMKAKKCKMR